MARVRILDGPSKWDLMLALFDPVPGTGGRRTLYFRLKTKLQDGARLYLNLRGIVRPKSPNTLIRWKLIGDNEGWLPLGYSHEGIEIEYNPLERSGYVDLEPTSPCHSAKIDFSLGDGVRIGSCSECEKNVARVNPRTGTEEWLNGRSPWDPRDDLVPVIRI